MGNPSDSLSPRWLLALESSTPHGGAALLRDGAEVGVVLLEEGLRHGRELMPAAAKLLEDAGLAAKDLWAVAVSSGPGSYTGLRVGVMAAKALAYGVGCKLAAVSSLQAMAASLLLNGTARITDLVLVLQDARRDEVYAGLYRLDESGASAVIPDVAVAPEEAKEMLTQARDAGGGLHLAGSGFSTYADLFGPDAASAVPGRVSPVAVGLLGWRQLLQENSADPLSLQPHYLRRDAGADWSKDALITESRQSAPS